jgi:hypothetical protein
MTTDQKDKKKLFETLDDTTSQFLQLVSSFDEQEINRIPYDGSWTVAQIAEHVALSNMDIENQLSKEGKVCGKEPDAGVEKIRSIFLNFSKKLNAPDFILPTRDIYQRHTVISNLKTSIDQLTEVSKKEDLLQIIHHRIFGEVTRLETLYFVIYHTQRHIHQLKNIKKIIQPESKSG